MKGCLFALFLGALILIGAGCESSPAGTTVQPEKTGSGSTNPVVTNKMDDVCNFFPKELVESAIGKPVVYVEGPLLSMKNCAYYTEYSETYNYAPGGRTPGGRSIQLVLENASVTEWKAAKEKGGDRLETDPSIGMDHYIVRNHAGRIWQVALILGSDKFFRMHFIQDAIDGPTLVKFAAKLAETINN